ncbi:MAG: hypothetical protein IJO43_00125 [Bacilli bacterium]|nr:hypothetical protein [Bacilli bacterium]
MKKKDNQNKYNLSSILDFLTNKIVIVIKKINKVLTDKKKSTTIRAIIRIVLCVLILGVLEVPFFLLGKIGEIAVYLISPPFKEEISVTLISIIDYSYLLFSLITFFKVLLDMSQNKEYKLEIKDNNLYEIICTVLKVLISLSLIPLILMIVLLFLILGMLICLMTHNMMIIGPIIIVIGLIIVILTTLSYIYDIVFSNERGNK